MTGPEILAARQSLGLSQATLADRLGVDVMTISRWERGEREPAPYLRLALQHLACKPRKRKVNP